MQLVLSNAQRGQTFPVWAMGSLSLLVLVACVVNYGNMLVWQFRAQNAADAAARGMLSAQTSQWNQTMSLLHAAAVEEYRIRYILRDLDEVANNEGGCVPHPPTSNDPKELPGDVSSAARPVHGRGKALYDGCATLE